jgi:hypothetical protein
MQSSGANGREVTAGVNPGSDDNSQGGSGNREAEFRDSGENGTVSTSPVRPLGYQKKRVLGTKAASAHNEMRRAIASGAQSIRELVEIGQKRLKIAESTFEVSIFSDPTTPGAERAAFYARKRAEILKRHSVHANLQHEPKNVEISSSEFSPIIEASEE